MTKALEAFKASDQYKALPPEQRESAEKFYTGISEVHNLSVDSCIDLVIKWGEVKQITQDWDFKMLIEHLGKLKD